MDEKEERDNIIAALRELEYNKKESEEAADYAIEQKPEAPLEDKVKCALNYLNSDKILKGE